MHRILFQNRWNALVFVVAILFSVLVLVGTENERGAIQDATVNFGSSGSTPQAATQPQSGPEPEQQEDQSSETIATAFTADEDLIDDAEGFDPSGSPIEPMIDVGPDLENAEDKSEDQSEAETH